MNIGVTDLASFEPCDKNLRPLWKIKCVNEDLKGQVEQLVTGLSEYFKIVDWELDELDYFGK